MGEIEHNSRIALGHCPRIRTMARTWSYDSIKKQIIPRDGVILRECYTTLGIMTNPVSQLSGRIKDLRKWDI